MSRDPSIPPLKIVIVGGGPAGLTAAIAAAERGAHVVLCEQLDRPGAKLLASGGGRCNLTNTLPGPAFMASLGRQGRFATSALAAMDNVGLRDFFGRLGVPTVVEAASAGEASRLGSSAGLVYPASQSAVSVQSALWRRCRELGGRVEIRLQARVTGLAIQGAELRGVNCESGLVGSPGGRVILATGGRGYPDLGGSGIGYVLATQAGHTIVPPVPALVPLVCADKWISRCAGLALPLVRIRIKLPGQSTAGQLGELMFTTHGISGPAVLDISGDVAELLRHHPQVPLQVDLAPGTAVEQWLAAFDAWSHEEGGKMLRTLLGRGLKAPLPATPPGGKENQSMPARLVDALLALADINPDARTSQVSRQSRDRLASLLTALPLTVTGTVGFRRAMVTRGGVSLKEVDPNTLQSRLTEGLYLAGELLDLAGPSGGFNLQWAFSSGWLAGLSAAESLGYSAPESVPSKT